MIFLLTDFIMTEMNQIPQSPTSGQVDPGLSLITRAATNPTSRFHGDGVRYKAKLIGVDPVTRAEGEKMCWDSMMKLKGFEAAFRKQGKHKQRVWMKISSSGVKILDERSGAEIHHHEKSKISSVTKDESDVRALAYIYQHQESYLLFYFRMANLAEPVLNDIREVCQMFDQETPQQTPEETPAQSSALFVLEEGSLPPEGPALENVFSPPTVSTEESKPVSPSNELMQVFSVPLREPIEPNLCPTAVFDTEPVAEPPKPSLSNTQILSMFPSHSAGGAPYPPSANMPWAQQGVMGNQWVGPMGPAVAPWPTLPSGIAAWPPAAPPTGNGTYIQLPPPNTVTRVQAPNPPQNLLL